MSLEPFKGKFVEDEGHWYVSKVKQFTPESINQMARGLAIFADLLSTRPNPKTLERFNDFAKGSVEQTPLFELKARQVPVTNKSKLFLALQIVSDELVSTAHVEQSNPQKFEMFTQIQDDFLNGSDYENIVKKYSQDFITNEFQVHYRNFSSWLSKFGFMGIESKSMYITEAGEAFIQSANSLTVSNAIFTQQIRKLQVWNPTIDNKYRNYKIKPFYAILQILLHLPDHILSKMEYVLFVSKLKSHDEVAVQEIVGLIIEYRLLNESEQEQFIEEIRSLDKKRYPSRARTNFDRLLDSFGKEIHAYTSTSCTQVNGKGMLAITNLNLANQEVEDFLQSPRYIDFFNKYDWIWHLGKMEGLSIDEIIEMYVRGGKPRVEIEKSLEPIEKNITEKVTDKLLEKEIESFFEKNLKRFFPDLNIVERPNYGRQFPTHVGPIDLLCIHSDSKTYYVIEFKRGRVPDETIGQILRYMGWVYIHLSQSDDKVRGIIIGSNFSDKFDYAKAGLQDQTDLIILYQHNFSNENRPILI